MWLIVLDKARLEYLVDKLVDLLRADRIVCPDLLLDVFERAL